MYITLTLLIYVCVCVLFALYLIYLNGIRQQYIPYNARGGDARRGRGGFQGSPGGLTHRDSSENKDGQMPVRVPPPTYVCYRCGQKGEWCGSCRIHSCLTMNP